MKLYSIVQYRFTEHPYIQPGIQYIESYKLNEQGFIVFIQNTAIYSITFNSSGRQIHSQLNTINEFYDGLYFDITNNRYYIISSFDI